MKTYFPSVTAILFTIFLSACSPTVHTSRDRIDEPKVVDRGYDMVLEKDATQSVNTTKPNENYPSNRTLADMIRSLPGVSVSGQDNNLKIRIGGISSFGNNDPLFVINGSPSGLDFSQIAASINPNEITSVSVLKGSDASIYGTRGANGVILIRTK